MQEEIATPRLILEPLVPVHADALFAGLCDEQLYEFIDDVPPVDVETLRLRYERSGLGVSPDGHELWRNWAVRRRHDDRYAGFVQATIVADRSTAIAYVLFRTFWGHGYGREAVAAMLTHLRDAEAVTTFRATVDPRNVRSVALLESLGFQQIECRVGIATIHGVPSDEAEYALSET